MLFVAVALFPVSSGVTRVGGLVLFFIVWFGLIFLAWCRRALSLWWHDCTAKALGETHDGLTGHQLNTASLNKLDHSKILPVDLAVTRSGVHIMAYLGGDTWIEADPGVGRVITVLVPTIDNLWCDTSMTIVRWNVLSQ